MSRNHLIKTLHNDKKLLALSGGIVCTFALMLSLAIAASAWLL